MPYIDKMKQLREKYIVDGDHSGSDYFSLIQEMIMIKNTSGEERWQQEIDKVYSLVRDEISTNNNSPIEPIKFGTSGWLGVLGKDVYARTVHV